MACGVVTPAVQKTLRTAEADMMYEPYTDWMPVTGIDDVLATTKARAVLGTPSYVPALQFAAVRTDDPGPWKDLSLTPDSGAKERNWGVVALTSGLSAASQFFVRFGMGYKSSADDARASCDVQLEVQFNQCGGIVGSSQVHAFSNDTTNYRHVPVTGWIPSTRAAKVKAALIASGLTGGIDYRLAYQKALTSTENPGTWTLLGPTYTTTAENNTGELTPSYGSPKEMWIRFGVGYRAGPAGVFDAMISAAVAVRST